VGLTATNATTGGLHVDLAWNSEPLAQGYQLERELMSAPGVWTILPFIGLGPLFQDFTVVDATAYGYRVASKNQAGLSAYSSIATVTTDDGAPAPPPPGPVMVSELEAPKNLRCKPFATGATTDDRLTWDGCVGALSYNVYSNEIKIGSATAPTTTFNVPNSSYKSGAMYGVTAIVPTVDMGNVETRVCTQVSAQGSRPTIDFDPAPAAAPTGVTGTPQWQTAAGGGTARPRNLITWNSPNGQKGFMWNVYKDNVLIAECLWQLFYIDDNVVASSSHQYKVSAVYWMIAGLTESPISANITVVALAAAPTGGGTVTGLSHIKNDDSVILTLPALPAGAVDWRCYPQGTADYKYVGGNTGKKCEINGIPRNTPTIMVVDAIATLGPFDFDERPKNHMLAMHVNGHGDPSNCPAVIATGTISVQPLARSFMGTQPFLDCFDVSPTFTPTVPDVRIRDIGGGQFHVNDLSHPWYREFTATNWIYREYIADAVNSRRFFGHTHEMDVLYDGGAPGGQGGDPSPSHNNNATVLWESRHFADVPTQASGNWLHCTWEVDAFMDPRRWCGFGLCPSGDIITQPAIQKLNPGQSPTWSGNSFAWEQNYDLHTTDLFVGTSGSGGGGGNGTGVRYQLVNTGFVANSIGPTIRGTVADRTVLRPDGLPFNGDSTRIDCRHKFDAFFNQSQYKVYEEGVLVLAGNFPVPLPITLAKFWVSHHVYHTHNARVDHTAWGFGSRFHCNHRQYSEARHWDNLGIRVTNGINL
jgi:hypothetical protein